MTVSPSVKRIFGLSLQESRNLDHSYIGPEHLLLGLVRQVDNPWVEPDLAGEILRQVGVDIAAFRNELISRLIFD